MKAAHRENVRIASGETSRRLDELEERGRLGTLGVLYDPSNGELDRFDNKSDGGTADDSDVRSGERLERQCEGIERSCRRGREDALCGLADSRPRSVEKACRIKTISVESFSVHLALKILTLILPCELLQRLSHLDNDGDPLCPAHLPLPLLLHHKRLPHPANPLPNKILLLSLLVALDRRPNLPQHALQERPNELALRRRSSAAREAERATAPRRPKVLEKEREGVRCRWEDRCWDGRKEEEYSRVEGGKAAAGEGEVGEEEGEDGGRDECGRRSFESFGGGGRRLFFGFGFSFGGSVVVAFLRRGGRRDAG